MPAALDTLTPCERHGSYWLKRDDLFCVNGAPGGKARTCLALAEGAEGLVTAGSRHSPQVDIVARVAEHLGVPARCHVPAGEDTPELVSAREHGAEVIQHRPGHNSVIVARAREDAGARGWQGWREIPFGMECWEAVIQTSKQVANLPAECERLVVPVGSGMSLAGILTGLRERGLQLPVLGVWVGASPLKRLGKYAPFGWDWGGTVHLDPAGVPYHEAVQAEVGGVLLDPIYEAKCVAHMLPGDCLWCVGIRSSEVAE